MSVLLHNAEFTRLSDEELAAWAGADAAGVSDCLERSMAMDGGMDPLDHSMRIIGQARTVRCMVGDNGALHAAINIVRPGEVLVVDAQGFLGRAVWGGLMTQAAIKKGIKGLVVDGAIRDRSEICDSGFPCFARGSVPAGPHKGFGGAIDCAISCGGVAVQPGDLIVADADGVTVVPLDRVKATLAAYLALKKKEAKTLASLDNGGTLADVYGAPEITRV